MVDVDHFPNYSRVNQFLQFSHRRMISENNDKLDFKYTTDLGMHKWYNLTGSVWCMLTTSPFEPVSRNFYSFFPGGRVQNMTVIL